MTALTGDADIRTAYRRQTVLRAMVLAGLALLCMSGFAGDLLTGPAALGPGETFSALIHPDAATPQMQVIVWQLRLPVALAALLVGAALALAGAEMQTVLDNPLASPFTLGVSSAASLGAALAIILGLALPGLPPELAVAGNAFLFAFLSVLLIQALARRSRRGPDDLVLFGIALVFTFEAAVSLLQFVASADALQQLVFWNMGSLARADRTALLTLTGVLLLVLPFSLRSAWKLTALRLGAERAQSFGIDVGRLRLWALVRVSLLAATAVAFVGTVAFIGLVGPHIARMLVGEDQRFFLPASALTGAAILSAASIASKTILPGVLVPIGIVTAFVGLPVFFLLILRRRGGL